MLLTKEEINHILLLEVEVIHEERGYILAKRVTGYSKHRFTAQLQAKLSVLLQVATKTQQE